MQAERQAKRLGGLFRAGVLLWRVIDGESLQVRHEGELPFDPRQPLDVLVRLEFEIAGLLAGVAMKKASEAWSIQREKLGKKTIPAGSQSPKWTSTV